jgi:lipoic acid synthetase
MNDFGPPVDVVADVVANEYDYRIDSARDAAVVSYDRARCETATADEGSAQSSPARPAWLRVKAARSEPWRMMLENLYGLHTVCQEAKCPNIGECFGRGAATFMILGRVCTRTCRFCAVSHRGARTLDPGEPVRLAEAVEKLGLRHVVITSVTRDDLPDGGASVFAECIREIRKRSPGVTIEVLTPDFRGDMAALELVMLERPDIFNHNVETAPRLYKLVRPQAKYPRSLAVLAEAKRMYPDGLTKSGLMVGLGEEMDEVVQVLRDLRANDVDMLTIGQYMQPNPTLLPVFRYVPPDEFDEYGRIARELGFRGVASGPLVRSSYWADRTVAETIA